MSVDVVARVIAGAGLVVALGGLGLTAYLWFRSGPGLKVTAWMPLQGGLHIQVASVGRFTAVVKVIELRDHFIIQTPAGRSQPMSRWSLPAMTQAQPLPRELAPSDFVEARVDTEELGRRAQDVPELIVTAWAQRGDGKWSSSKPIKIK
jgi:hypothetical protein